VFERFNARARHVVVLAQDEARGLKHDYIGTEHILLGLVCENEGTAARILLDFDNTETIRNEILRMLSGAGLREQSAVWEPRTLRFASGRSSAVRRWFQWLTGAALLGFGLLIGRLIWG
jgi:ATP-dependent Clp protease ATP-binding subunit ClpA